jgi:hypothetical protein
VNNILLIKIALRIETKILFACLLQKDWSEKPDPQGNAQT